MTLNIIKYGDCSQMEAFIERDFRGIFQLYSGVKKRYSVENLGREVGEARQNLAKRVIPLPDDVIAVLSADINENMPREKEEALRQRLSTFNKRNAVKAA